MDVTVEETDRRHAARRLPGLDGLRAVAVTGVLLFHGGVAAVPGGFLGVDLFFVLSGFLITTLLLAEARTHGTVDVVAFWARRARRLLPGLLLMSLTTVLVFTAFPSAADPTELRGAALAALVYVANWHFLLAGEGYFEQLDVPSPLQHTWSLSIEEQFYVVWPLLLLLGIRLRLARWVVATGVAVGALASGAWMAYLHRQEADVDRLYYATDTRAHTILLGVVTALILVGRAGRPRGRRRSRESVGRSAATLLAGTALAGVLAAMCLVAAEDARLYRGGLVMFSTGSALLVAAVASSPTGVVTRVLEWVPVRAVGVLSYSLYLWHWPVFVFLNGPRTSMSGPPLLAVRLAATVLLAMASYRLVELPLRRSVWRPRHLTALPVGAIAAGCGLVLAVSLAASALGPVPAAEPSLRGPAALVEQRPASARLPDQARHEHVLRAPSGTSSTPPGLQVTVLGDSTARSLAEGLRDRPGADGVTWRNAATVGCGALPPSSYRYAGVLNPWAKRHCRGLMERWRDRVAARPTDVVVVLLGRWEVADRVVDGQWAHVGEPPFDTYLRERLHRAIDAAGSDGATVVVLTAPYYSRGEQLDGSIWPEDDPARVDAFNSILRSVAADRGVAVAELGRRTSGENPYFVAVLDGVPLRYDGVHFTAAAARWLQPWLEGRLLAAAAGT